MARILLKASEVDVAAGFGNSITASNATLVRVLNPTGTATVPRVTEFFEKQPSYNIYGNATIHVAPVGYGAN